MRIENVSAHGMGQGSETLSGQIDEWDTQLEHHVQQQAQQVAAQKCDVDASPTSCDVRDGKWRVEMLLLGDWDSGDLFVADQWKYTEGDVRVTYDVDETDAMEQVRNRLDDALKPLVVDETPFAADMLQFGSVSWYNDRYSNFRYEI